MYTENRARSASVMMRMCSLHGKNSIAEKTIQNLSSAKYQSWLYDIGIVVKMNAWRTETRILPSHQYNFVRATIEV